MPGSATIVRPWFSVFPLAMNVNSCHTTEILPDGTVLLLFPWDMSTAATNERTLCLILDTFSNRRLVSTLSTLLQAGLDPYMDRLQHSSGLTWLQQSSRGSLAAVTCYSPCTAPPQACGFVHPACGFVHSCIAQDLVLLKLVSQHRPWQCSQRPCVPPQGVCTVVSLFRPLAQQELGETGLWATVC